MKKLVILLAMVLFFGFAGTLNAAYLGSIEGTGSFFYSWMGHCSSWTLDLEFTSNEAGMCGYDLDISGNNSFSTWSIFNVGVTVDSGTTGPISWDSVTSKIIFELFDSRYYDDLVFTGYRCGNSNPYYIVNAGLEGDPLIPIPPAIWLFCSGLIGVVGFRKKMKKWTSNIQCRTRTKARDEDLQKAKGVRHSG